MNRGAGALRSAVGYDAGMRSGKSRVARAGFVVLSAAVVTSVAWTLLRATVGGSDAGAPLPFVEASTPPAPAIDAPVVAATPVDHRSVGAAADESSPSRRIPAFEDGAGGESDRTVEGGRVVVEAHIADLEGVELERKHVLFLLPNRHPYRSALDGIPAKGRSAIVAIDSAPGASREGVDVDCVLRDLYGGRSGISFELDAAFAGVLELIVRDSVVSRLDWKVGDPDPVFRVDLAAIRGRLATLRIGLEGLPPDAVPDFVVRVEREGDLFGEGLSGEARSIARSPLVLNSLPAGKYRIAARSDSLAIAPAVVELHEGEDRRVDLVVVPEARVTIRFIPYRGESPSEFTSLSSWSGLEVRTLGGAMRHPQGCARVSKMVAAPVPAASDGTSDGSYGVDVEIAGLVPGPCILLVGSNRLDANLVAGENPMLVFPIRAARFATFEVETRAAVGETAVNADLRVYAADGLELASEFEALLLRDDRVGVTTVDLIPGSYRVAMRLASGRRVESRFTVDDVIPARVVLK